MEDLPVERLRIRTSEYVARAELGEAFVVMRHQQPLAVLRPCVGDDPALRVPVSRFRGGLRVWLMRAQRQRLLVTWRGRRVAMVEPIDATVEPIDATRNPKGDWR
jgi:antitoxin (DNA-binding transcriptional repressor) of toxin-antitoxin stability system